VAVKAPGNAALISKVPRNAAPTSGVRRNEIRISSVVPDNAVRVREALDRVVLSSSVVAGSVDPIRVGLIRGDLGSAGRINAARHRSRGADAGDRAGRAEWN
jgi:hypothetical protein